MNIYDIASRKLSMSMKTEKELRKFLLEKGFEIEEVDQLIAEYKQLRYIDDVTYGKLFLKAAFRKGRGKSRAMRELLAKGVNKDDAEKAYSILVEESEEEDFFDKTVISEEERALKLVEKILKGESLEDCTKLDDRTLGRISRRLASQGYSSSIVFKILERYR